MANLKTSKNIWFKYRYQTFSLVKAGDWPSHAERCGVSRNIERSKYRIQNSRIWWFKWWWRFEHQRFYIFSGITNARHIIGMRLKQRWNTTCNGNTNTSTNNCQASHYQQNYHIWIILVPKIKIVQGFLAKYEVN